MFTGIVEGLGVIRAIRPAGEGRRITVLSDFALDRTGIGDSIAVNGACLTAVRVDRNTFDADVSPETMARTTFRQARVGDRVNLERALRLSDRIDGHLVSGHIDGVGTLLAKTPDANALRVTIAVPEALAGSMILKGSVAVDGVSLTINTLARDRFEVSVIPHTAGITAMGAKKAGDAVNIETDMIGKYVQRFLTAGNDPKAGGPSETPAIDRSFLAKTGFLS